MAGASHDQFAGAVPNFSTGAMLAAFSEQFKLKFPHATQCGECNRFHPALQSCDEMYFPTDGQLCTASEVYAVTSEAHRRGTCIYLTDSNAGISDCWNYGLAIFEMNLPGESGRNSCYEVAVPHNALNVGELSRLGTETFVWLEGGKLRSVLTHLELHREAMAVNRIVDQGHAIRCIVHGQTHRIVFSFHERLSGFSNMRYRGQL